MAKDAGRMIRVWDLGVRLFHWGLVAGVAAAYLLAEERSLHRQLGYVVMGLIVFRLIWGLVGTQHARWTSFIPGPRACCATSVTSPRGARRAIWGIILLGRP